MGNITKVVLTGIIFFVLHSRSVLKSLGVKNASICDNRENAKLSPLLLLFFFGIILNLFGAQSIDIVFNSQIYTYARCTGSTMKEANLLNSVFWFAYGASRLIAIFVSTVLKPRDYILTALLGKC